MKYITQEIIENTVKNSLSKCGVVPVNGFETACNVCRVVLIKKRQNKLSDTFSTSEEKHQIEQNIMNP